jgi:hypothetical protein
MEKDKRKEKGSKKNGNVKRKRRKGRKGYEEEGRKPRLWRKVRERI